MTEYYDSLETADPEAREDHLFRRLPGLIAKAVEAAPGWATHLAGVDAGEVVSRTALARVPVLRKAELKDRQAASPPFAGFAVAGREGFARVFTSPGPIFEPMPATSDPWRGARAMYAAGFRAGDLIHNSFSYHLTPGGFIMDSSARALGCCVFPAGTGNTEQQVQAMAQFRPVGYAGTPDYLKVILDKGAETGADLGSVKKALVSGGALFPSLREDYAGRGVRVLQCYATAELGIISYESEAMEGMIVNEDTIVEIVRPGTGHPVAEGEVGEVVVTTFSDTYPMIRLATGDLSAVLPGMSPCGRTNMRLKGWLGRADQTAKVKGMFVHPSQVAEIARRHPELGRLRLVVTRKGANDEMTLHGETPRSDAALAGAIEETIAAVCKVRGSFRACAPGSLPNDGKVIVDERDYSA